MSPHCASRSTPMTSIILVWKPASGVRFTTAIEMRVCGGHADLW